MLPLKVNKVVQNCCTGKLYTITVMAYMQYIAAWSAGITDLWRHVDDVVNESVQLSILIVVFLKTPPISPHLFWRILFLWPFLSTHADRQGADISFTVCLCACLFVCTVTNFSADDKPSGVTFCSAVHRRKARNHKFLWTLLPQKPKIGRIGQRADHAHLHVNTNVEMRRRKRYAKDVPFEYTARRVDVKSACVDIRQSPSLTYLSTLPFLFPFSFPIFSPFFHISISFILSFTLQTRLFQNCSKFLFSCPFHLPSLLFFSFCQLGDMGNKPRTAADV